MLQPQEQCLIGWAVINEKNASGERTFSQKAIIMTSKPRVTTRDKKNEGG